MAIWPYLAFGFVAGAMLPIQFGINAQLASWVDSPLRATLVSFAVGTLALFVVMLAAYRDWPSTGSLAGAPWWVWVGGLLGAFYVLGSVVAGQALASLAVDHFGWVGFEENPISLGRIGGMLLIAAGVVLVRIF